MIIKRVVIGRFSPFFLVCLQFFFCILTLTNCPAESSFPRIIFKDPYSSDVNMPEDSISYYFNQVKSMGANSIIGVCDSLSSKYGKMYGISIIPFNQYGGKAKQVKVTDRTPQYIEELTSYGFYLDLEVENEQLNEGYAFYHDTSVSIKYQDDDTVGQWCKVADHGPGFVFSGPIGGSVYNSSPLLLPTTLCTADYIMKIGDKTGDQNAVVGSLIIIDDYIHDTLRHPIKVSDFDEADVYDTLSISFNQTRWHRFCYELFWTDLKDLWVDKVIVSNDTGRVLFSLTEDSVKTALQYYYNSLDTQLYRWYLVDEPIGGSLSAIKWANELIRSIQPSSWDPSDTTSIFTTLRTWTVTSWSGRMADIYLDDIKAKELNVDHYPYDTTLNLQTELDLFCTLMDTCSRKAREYEKPFYATIQVHEWDICPGPTKCLSLRNPTPAEIKDEAYLALAYGATGLAYFWYTTTYYNKEDTTDWRGLGLVEWSPGAGEWVPNEKWYAVQEINFVLDKIGPTLLQLDWKGACTSDTVNKLDFSFIKRLESEEFDTTYVQVGFFKDTTATTNYFMLVNRRCLENESQNVISYINKGGTYLIIDLYEDDTTIAGYETSVGAIPFTTHLEPGEGKLFKLVPR